MRFEGTSAYVATDDLKVAVNAAITLERPLLVKGEPGTGKTVLALEVAKSLGAPLIEWHIKSTTKALQGLYEYDAVSRLRDSQLGDDRVHDIRNYIKRGKLWDAFVADARPVLLIDEIDKADIEFSNDLLLELDRMEFFVYETAETIKARRRPIWSSPPITRRNCPTRSCAAASSITSASPTRRPCARSWRCISPASSSAWYPRRSSCSTKSARFRG
jgi:MoxR-like ATPase